jgi:hypothetical protein
MSRTWNELVAAVLDVISPQLLLLLMFVATLLTAVLWYWFPAWVPRRLPRWRTRRLRLPRLRLPRLRLPRLRFPRLRLPHWDWRRLFRRRRKPENIPTPVASAPAPTGPAEAPRAVPGMSLADRLAAEGRYAEAIRQRLRDVVGDLINAGVVAPQPGWTAAELAAVAAAVRPATAAPLGHATDLFSEIWYGQRPALPVHDHHMRALTGDVRAALSDPGRGR